jgi:hypothetical protein
MHYVLKDTREGQEAESNDLSIKMRSVSSKLRSYFNEKYLVYKIILQPEFTKEKIESFDSEKCYLDPPEDQCHSHNANGHNHSHDSHNNHSHGHNHGHNHSHGHNHGHHH